LQRGGDQAIKLDIETARKSGNQKKERSDGGFDYDASGTEFGEPGCS